MSEIERVFNEAFRPFQISLAPEDLAQKRRGGIVQRGWAIWYLFGADARGEYMDYYAAHRMTNDRHVRIYADGTTESLPALCSMYFLPPGCTPEQEQHIRNGHTAENRQIAKMLVEKGFGLAGGEPGGVVVNRYLTLQDAEE